MLFQADLNPGLDLNETIPTFWRQQWTCKIEDLRDDDPRAVIDTDQETIASRVAPLRIRLFAEMLVRGVRDQLTVIDDRIFDYLQNWPMHRMGSVERNVLRLAFYEMMFCPEVPRVVVLNEAIDLAKYFSNADAGRFVNGILDKFNKDLPVPPGQDEKEPPMLPEQGE